MDISNFIIYGVLASLAIYTILIYNNLINLKHNITKSWANIDVLLKQRHDELPKLVATCQQYMKYEQVTFEKIIHARSAVQSAREAGDIKSLGQSESALRHGLGRLFALAEDYPDLKADKNFLHLSQRISGLENTIADRREFYNESVNNNNIRIEQFPDVILARGLGLKSHDLLKFSAEEKRDVDLQKLFSSPA